MTTNCDRADICVDIICCTKSRIHQAVETDLSEFFAPMISGMMALHEKGRADEKEPIY